MCCWNALPIVVVDIMERLQEVHVLGDNYSDFAIPSNLEKTSHVLSSGREGFQLFAVVGASS